MSFPSKKEQLQNLFGAPLGGRQSDEQKGFLESEKDLAQRKKLLLDEIEKLKVTPFFSITEYEHRKTLLSNLEAQLDIVERSKNYLISNRFQIHSESIEPVTHSITGGLNYIPYAQAYTFLEKRIYATPEEIAAWVYLGPNEGGLNAYVDINNSSTPKVFYFKNFAGKDTYLSQLMLCWFLREDIDSFQPEDRFITEEQLIKHWETKQGIQVADFIRAKIDENRLSELQPVVRPSQLSHDLNSQHLKMSLFSWSEVEDINRSDFGQDPLDIGRINDGYYPKNIYHHLIKWLKEFANENLSVLRLQLQRKTLSNDRRERINQSMKQLEAIQQYYPSPGGENRVENKQERIERLYKRVKEEKAKKTKNFNLVVSKEEGISVSRLKELLKERKDKLLEQQSAVSQTSEFVRSAVSRMQVAPHFFNQEEWNALASYKGQVVSGDPQGRVPEDLDADDNL